MPTLLQINVTANWGSTGKIAEQIGLVAQNKGWDSYIAYGRDMNPSRNKLIKIGSMLDVYEHYFENRFFDNEGRASCRATRKFLKEVDKIKPDLVHLHNIHDHYLNYELLLRYLSEKNIPVVWTQHDQWATTGHCCYNLVGCEKWKDLCCSCPLSKWYSLDCSKRNHKLKKKLIGDLPSLTIVPVSEWLAGNMRQSHLGNRPIEVIHNGIDLEVFKPQEMDVHKRYGIDTGKKIILGVADIWDERKGLKDFYKLAEKLSVDEYSIVIIGKVSGDADVTNCNSKKCQMIFVDRAHTDLELAQLYSVASVFVNKTYPTLAWNAILCGTPVVNYCIDCSSLVVDNQIGTVIEHGDIEGLTRAVIDLATKRPNSFLEEYKERAERIYEKNRCSNPYITLYNKLLGGNKIVVLGVSSVWHNNKGLEDFVQLSRNPDFVVILVGLKKEQIELFYSPEYKGCNIVPIMRTQNQYELSMLYSMADILLSLSYSETFGMTIAEGIACGSPCIVYDNTAQPELVTSDTGRVAKTGDIGDVTRLIYEMIESNFKANHSEDCRRRAEMMYDKNLCFEKYTDLYDSIVKVKGHCL